MDEKQLKKLLLESKEQDWFDFKEKLKIYQSDGKLVEKQRDELIKDIFGLANGNSHIVRKTKYLIIGVDDKKIDENGYRILYNVDYKVPSQSDLAKWLSSAGSPTIVGLECESVLFQGVNLFIITIPPTFDLYETTRELNASSHFNKHTVFMRQDEHTITAPVTDGITIQQLKHLYRHEVENPSAVWLGALIGGIVSVIFWGAGNKVPQVDPNLSNNIIKVIAAILGILFGAEIGWAVQVFNKTRYTWRYMTQLERVGLIIFLTIIILALYLSQLYLSSKS
jgi:hypothetical protein